MKKKKVLKFKTKDGSFKVYSSNGSNAQHVFMKKAQKSQISKGMTKAESWAYSFLKTTGLKWTSQAVWGWRVFDFWNAELGIAVEIDGPEHDEVFDEERDKYNFNRSGIKVFRVKNFYPYEILRVLDKIKESDTWLERREKMNLLTKSQKKAKNLRLLESRQSAQGSAS